MLWEKAKKIIPQIIHELKWEKFEGCVVEAEKKFRLCFFFREGFPS